MRASGWFVGAMLVTGIAACDPPAQVGGGQACNSLSECKPGLTCVEGVCEEDISSIAGEVPAYGDAAAGTGGAATGDAGAVP
jgi:hypothetical protein